MDEVIQNVQDWLNGEFSKETKEEIRFWAEKKNFDLLNDAFGKKLEWKCNGFRAKIGLGTNRINHYTLEAIAQAACNYFKNSTLHRNNTVAIAYDNRENNSFYAQCLVNVFTANSIKVWLFDMPTSLPVLAYAVKQLECDSGFMITGGNSHQTYNGVKFLDKNGFMWNEEMGEEYISHFIKTQKRNDIYNDINHDLIEFIPENLELAFIEKSSSFLPLSKIKKQLNIWYIQWNSVGSFVESEYFEQAGFLNLAAQHDHFGSNYQSNKHSVNYTLDDTLKACFDTANTASADLILTTNSDASRVAAAIQNKNGDFQQLTGQEIAILVTIYLLDRFKNGDGIYDRKQNVAVTKTLNPIICKKIKQHGFIPNFVSVGLSDIHFQNSEFEFGLDEFGGVLIPEISPVKDGFLTGLILAELAEESKSINKTLWNILEEVYLEEGLHLIEMEEVEFLGLGAERLVEGTFYKLQSNPPLKIDGSSAVVSKIIDHNDGSIMNLITGEVELQNATGEKLLEFQLSDGYKVFISPSKTAYGLKYYASCFQSVENRTQLQELNTTLTKKAKHYIKFFKKY